ncbi:MAG: PAS domain-containing protein [Chloroflexi bacterium]|nr:PAS domain-containing protein [Chloroflexota bacterium]
MTRETPLPKNDPDALRRRAEKTLRDKQRAPENLSHADMQEAISELRVHQIELGIQNEELRRAQSELEESRDRYSDLYDFAPVGYLTLDDKDIIREANLTAAAMLGVERARLLAEPLHLFYRARRQGYVLPVSQAAPRSADASRRAK